MWNAWAMTCQSSGIFISFEKDAKMLGWWHFTQWWPNRWFAGLCFSALLYLPDEHRAIIRQWWLCLLFSWRGSDSKRPKQGLLLWWEWVNWKGISYLCRPGVRQSLGRSNGWSSLGFNNQPTLNSDSGPFLEVAPLVNSAPTNYRRKNISQDLARNDETFLRMSCHFHPCCRKLNSHGFGPIKKLLDFGQC